MSQCRVRFKPVNNSLEMLVVVFVVVVVVFCQTAVASGYDGTETPLPYKPNLKTRPYLVSGVLEVKVNHTTALSFI